MTQASNDDLPVYEGAAQRAVLLAVLLIGAFALFLNQSLLNTALPALMSYFDITAAEAQWVTTLFMLVNGIIIPMTGWLIAGFTTRQLFITAMVLFTLGTLIAALSPTYWILLLGRVLQASASGIVMPLMQTILFSIFPPDQRGSAMGWFGLVIGVAPAIGPSLSGFIIDRWPWQYLFWLMLPIALLALAVSWAMLHNVTEQARASLDVLSVVLSTLGFGGLLFGFSMTGATGWASPEVIVSLVIGVVTLVWFVRRQLRLEEPLLELRVLTRPMFTLNTALIMLMFAAFMGALVVLPVIMQTGLGFSAMTSGLAMLPGALLMGLVSPLAGKIYDKNGARWLSVAGFALILATGILFTRVTPETTYLYMATVNAVRQIGPEPRKVDTGI